MTVYNVTEPQHVLIGLSTDTKPLDDIQPGTVFIEGDTGTRYVWCGDEERGTSADWYAQPPRGQFA